MTKDYRLLDSKLFKAFMAAADTENFTTAAQRIHMTQSGVSQHISKLEQQIGMPLFTRVGKRAFLTPTGMKLARYIEDYASNTAAFLDGLREDEAASGSVYIALPATCVTSPRLASVLEKKAEKPNLFLNITLGSSEEITRMLLRSDLDFGIVTERIPHGDLEFEQFCREEYVLVAHGPKTLAPITAENVKVQRYVFYPGTDHYLRVWLGHHFDGPLAAEMFTQLEFAASINSTEGAIRMVAMGLGVGVFPRHAVQSALDGAVLFEQRGRKNHIFNEIYLVTKRQNNYSRAVREVLSWFRETQPALDTE